MAWMRRRASSAPFVPMEKERAFRGSGCKRKTARVIMPRVPKAPVAGQRAIGERERNADDQIAQRAEAQTQSAAVIRGEHAAHGGFCRPKRIESQTLAVLGKSFLQRLNGATGSNGNGEVGPGVLRDFVEPCCRKDNVRARWWIPPAKFCAAAARDDRQPRVADKPKRIREVRFIARNEN